MFIIVNQKFQQYSYDSHQNLLINLHMISHIISWFY